MWHACELHDDGKALVTEEDFVTVLQRPSLDFERDTVAVRDGERDRRRRPAVRRAVRLRERRSLAPRPRHRRVAAPLVGGRGARRGTGPELPEAVGEPARRDRAARGRRLRAELGGLDLRHRARARARPARAAAGLRDPPVRPGPRRPRRPPRDRRRVRRMAGPRAGGVRRLGGGDARPAVVRARAPRHRRPRRGGRRRGAADSGGGARSGSPSSRSRAHIAGAGWGARCSSMPSGARGAPAAAASGSRPTRARARAGSTSTSGCA